MKYINEYTQEELVALNPEEIDRTIKLHLAEAGIQLLKEPETPKYHEIPEPDTTLYKVSGITPVFMNSDIATQVADLMNKNSHLLRLEEYDWNFSSDYKRVKSIHGDYQYKDDGFSVSTSKVYSHELYDQIKVKVKENKLLKEAYDEAKKKYDEVYESSKEISEEVMQTIYTARRIRDERETALNQFNEYLDLAEQNEEVAWKFLKKAHQITSDQEEYIKSQRSAT